MKKFKIFLAIAIAAIATVAAGFYSYQATQENLLAQEQDLLLNENIEALSVDWEGVWTSIKQTFSDEWADEHFLSVPSSSQPRPYNAYNNAYRDTGGNTKYFTGSGESEYDYWWVREIYCYNTAPVPHFCTPRIIFLEWRGPDTSRNYRAAIERYNGHH